MAVHSDVCLGSEYELYNAFDLTSFHSGIIYIDRNGGVFSFSADASWENSDNTKHLDGSIRKYSPNAFTFPSGHGGQYQPLHVSQAAGNSYIDVTYVAIFTISDTLLQKEFGSVCHRHPQAFGYHIR